MSLPWLFLLILLPLSMFGSFAAGQDRPRLPPLPPPSLNVLSQMGASAPVGTQRLFLLELDDVMSELKLPPEQQTRIANIKKEHMDELLTIIKKKQQELDRKLTRALEPKQAERLTEIVVQIAGVRALGDEEVAVKLGLNDKQKQEINKLAENEKIDGRLLLDSVGEGKLRIEEIPAKMQELQNTFERKMRASLTADQQNRFDDMEGTPANIRVVPQGMPGPGLPPLPPSRR